MADLNAKPAIECLDVPDNAYSDGAMTDWGIEMLESFSKSDKPFILVGAGISCGIRVKKAAMFKSSRKYLSIAITIRFCSR